MQITLTLTVTVDPEHGTATVTTEAGAISATSAITRIGVGQYRIKTERGDWSDSYDLRYPDWCVGEAAGLASAVSEAVTSTLGTAQIQLEDEVSIACSQTRGGQ